MSAASSPVIFDRAGTFDWKNSLFAAPNRVIRGFA
jgi:hypothetical protein